MLSTAPREDPGCFVFFLSSCRKCLQLLTPLLLFGVQSAADGARLQQRGWLPLQVLRPLTLQTVPRGRGRQRRRPQRHLGQLQRVGSGGRERQLPVRLSGGTRKKSKKKDAETRLTSLINTCLILSRGSWVFKQRSRLLTTSAFSSRRRPPR